MKAHFRSNGADKCQVVEFEPENEAEGDRLREFGLLLSSSYMISHRGFTYMNPVVSVYIQPLPRGD